MTDSHPGKPHEHDSESLLREPQLKDILGSALKEVQPRSPDYFQKILALAQAGQPVNTGSNLADEVVQKQRLRHRKMLQHHAQRRRRMFLGSIFALGTMSTIALILVSFRPEEPWSSADDFSSRQMDQSSLIATIAEPTIEMEPATKIAVAEKTVVHGAPSSLRANQDGFTEDQMHTPSISAKGYTRQTTAKAPGAASDSEIRYGTTGEAGLPPGSPDGPGARSSDSLFPSTRRSYVASQRQSLLLEPMTAQERPSASLPASPAVVEEKTTRSERLTSPTVLRLDSTTSGTSESIELEPGSH
jgi:hypothetical protein